MILIPAKSTPNDTSGETPKTCASNFRDIYMSNALKREQESFLIGLSTKIMQMSIQSRATILCYDPTTISKYNGNISRPIEALDRIIT